MSKKNLEINIVLGGPPDSLLVAKIWMVKQGDLYITHHLPEFTAGKYSYHASGVTHSVSDLLGRRSGEGEPPSRKLAGITGYQYVSGWSIPQRPEHLRGADSYAVKVDTKVRRTLFVPECEFGWHFDVWAIERGHNTIVEKIAATNPWPKVPILSTVLADWSDPWILLTVACPTVADPYKIVKYTPALPGLVPYVYIPEAFEGTWLEKPGAKWRPGEPFPEEWLRKSDDYVVRQRRRAAHGTARLRSPSRGEWRG